MPMLHTARAILIVICGSYLLSALILLIARSRGQMVSIPVITTWAVLGLVGFTLLPMLQSGRWPVIMAIAIVLGPWMGYSLWGDLRTGHWIVAVTDVAGLFAIAYALWLVR